MEKWQTWCHKKNFSFNKWTFSNKNHNKITCFVRNFLTHSNYQSFQTMLQNFIKWAGRQNSSWSKRQSFTCVLWSWDTDQKEKEERVHSHCRQWECTIVWAVCHWSLSEDFAGGRSCYKDSFPWSAKGGRAKLSRCSDNDKAGLGSTTPSADHAELEVDLAKLCIE